MVPLRRFFAFTLMFCFTTSLAWSYSQLPSFELSEKKISTKRFRKEGSLNFQVYPFMLNNGTIQMSSDYLSPSDFRRTELPPLDFNNLLRLSDSMFVVSKVATVFANKTADVFTGDLMRNPHFIQNVLKDSVATPTEHNNVIFVRKTIEIGPKSFTPEFLIRVDHFNINDPQYEKNPMVATANSFDSEFGQPENIAILHFSAEDDRYYNDGGVMVFKFYNYKGKALMVSYQILSIKKSQVPYPTWIVKRYMEDTLENEVEFTVRGMKNY